MDQIRNVIVFGDSLSDIGVKWMTGMGKFAKKIGAMTVNPSGRFSDCRNWTDFMYEEAAGRTLVTGTPAATITASRPHLRLTQQSGWLNPSLPAHKRFFYANYAEGGACGGIPTGVKGKIGLGQFKDQVKKFETDFKTLYTPPPRGGGAQMIDWTAGENAKLTLFLVWFGANDLYTAGCKPEAMAAVAEKIANKRRHELSAIVGAKNARFIFMNLARPEASVRYQHEKRDRLGTKKDRFYKATGMFGGGVENELRELARGVDLFNQKLLEHAAENGDSVVDIASVAHPDVVGGMVQALGLLEGAQKEGTSKIHVPARIADAAAEAAQIMGEKNIHMTTSDKAHPTDRIYKLMWDNIKRQIQIKQFAFGHIG